MNINPYQDFKDSLNEIEQKAAPEELFWKGDFSLITEGRRVSIVGSRKASREGLIRAEIIASALIELDITVVSGLALGIDTVAHKTAIEKKGKTIAVVGTPLESVYPAANRDLYSIIEHNHLAVSQFPKGYPFQKKNFPIRNRTMALISDATIIIEATENSGTRHQGWEALRLGRTVYLLENLVNDSNLKWAREMIGYGAQILTRDSFKETLDDIPYLTSKNSYAF